MMTSHATRITLVTRYLIGRLTCERHKREFCTRPFKITELEKGRWSWISNYGEVFHTDSWLAEANPGHSDRDAILKALLPGPRTVVLFGPGKARMLLLGIAGTGAGMHLSAMAGEIGDNQAKPAHERINSIYNSVVLSAFILFSLSCHHLVHSFLEFVLPWKKKELPKDKR